MDPGREHEEWMGLDVVNFVVTETAATSSELAGVKSNL